MQKYRTDFTYDGKRYTIRADSEEELLEKKFNRIRDLREGKVTICSSMPLGKWVDECLSTYKVNVSKDTLECTRLRLRKHLIEPLGHMPLKSIKPAHLQKILNQQEGMSQAHVEKLIYELRFIFDRAIDNELINKNPAAKLVMPRTTKGKRRSLTDNEEKHFLMVCEKDPAFRLFELMYYCGCRPGEAIGAIGKDLETIDGILYLHIRGTKTINADRYVPVPAVFRSKVVNTPPFAPIAPNRANNAHTESSYKRLVKALERAMNISMGCRVYRNQLLPPFPLAEDFVPYCLRHTYCTNLAKAGVDIRTAQKLMGHSSIQLTANIYTHVDKSQIKSALNLIDSFHNSQSTEVACVNGCVKGA